MKKFPFKKTLMYAALTIAAAYGLFLGGYWAGRAAAESRFHVQMHYLTVLNSLQAYSAEADIAEALTAKNESDAFCLANVHASGYATVVRTCLESAACRSMIEDDVRRIAPEFLTGGKLRVKYYAPGERCK